MIALLETFGRYPVLAVCGTVLMVCLIAMASASIQAPHKARQEEARTERARIEGKGSE
jgi:cell division protein FtsL